MSNIDGTIRFWRPATFTSAVTVSAGWPRFLEVLKCVRWRSSQLQRDRPVQTDCPSLCAAAEQPFFLREEKSDQTPLLLRCHVSQRLQKRRLHLTPSPWMLPTPEYKGFLPYPHLFFCFFLFFNPLCFVFSGRTSQCLCVCLFFSHSGFHGWPSPLEPAVG